MTLTGPEALRSLEEALRDVRREEDEITRRLARSAELIAKTRETEGELFRKLAKVRLDPATQAELTGRLSQAEAKARAVQKAQSKKLADAEATLGRLDQAIAELGTQRAEALKTLAERQAALDALRARVAREIADDPAFIKLQAHARALSEIATVSQEKTAQADADREVKGRPYRGDALFMYLWETGYGTPGYRANNLVRYLDGLVARHVGFHKARPNFAMLNEIPIRLREHADRQAANAADAHREVAAFEDVAMDGAGGKPLRTALAAAEAAIAEIEAKTVAAEDQRDQAAKAQHELAQGEDPAVASAHGELADTLSREDIATLLAEARATRTGQDDTLVAQIDAARARAAEEERETADQKQRLRTLANRRRELEDIQFEFKKQRFDDPRSSFGNDKLAGDMLTDFLRGGVTAATYWNTWRQSQRWSGGGPQGSGRDFQWPDSSFAGGGNRGNPGGTSWGRLPGLGGGMGGGSSSGGGFSRPRTGSSGNRNYGGFKTGGGV